MTILMNSENTNFINYFAGFLLIVLSHFFMFSVSQRPDL